MMDTDPDVIAFQKRICKNLSYNAVKIALAFFFTHRALDDKEIREWTGIRKRETVTANMQDLIDEKLVTKQVLGHNRFLYVPNGNLLPGFDPASQLSDERTSSALTVTATTESLILKESIDSVVVVGKQMSANRTSGISLREKPKRKQRISTLDFSQFEHFVYQEEGVTFEKNYYACTLCHIGDPSRLLISELEWVSPDFIKAHVNDLEPGDTIGLAINRIKGNELPRSWEEQYRKDAQEAAEERRQRLIAAQAAEALEEDQEPEEELERDSDTGDFCFFQEIVGTMSNGSPRYGRFCGKPCKQGSSRWCPDHYDEAIQLHPGIGEIETETT